MITESTGGPYRASGLVQLEVDRSVYFLYGCRGLQPISLHLAMEF